MNGIVFKHYRLAWITSCIALLGGAFALWSVRAGQMHLGLVPLLCSDEQYSNCRVNIDGFLGCYVIIVVQESAGLALVNGRIEVFTGTNSIQSVQIDTLARDKADFYDPKVGFAIYATKFMPSAGFQKHNSLVTVRLTRGSNSVPFEVWLACGISGTRNAPWKSYRYVDFSATNRVEKVNR